MIKLHGEKIYLATLEREDCKKTWDDFEYDVYEMPYPFIVGRSSAGSDAWFDEIQKKQGKSEVLLGIFLPGGTVVGDIALQGLDWQNRTCSLGYTISKCEYRGKGYMTDAVNTMLRYGFHHLGLERVSAGTQEFNIGSQRVLEKCGFTLEGRERKAQYLAGKRHDRLIYGLLAEEFERGASMR